MKKDQNHPEMQGGFAWSHWCDGAACEEKISKDLAVTIQFDPFNPRASGSGSCVVCGSSSVGRVVLQKVIKEKRMRFCFLIMGMFASVMLVRLYLVAVKLILKRKRGLEV